MDDPLSRQISGRGRNRLSGRQPILETLGAQRLALLEDAGATCPMNGAVDAASSQQRAVGGIDHGVYCLASDVTSDQLDVHGLDTTGTTITATMRASNGG
jgi:hypothetical protein